VDQREIIIDQDRVISRQTQETGLYRAIRIVDRRRIEIVQNRERKIEVVVGMIDLEIVGVVIVLQMITDRFQFLDRDRQLRRLGIEIEIGE